MHSFSQFNIQPSGKSFVGTKIPFEDLFNKTIIVKDFIIEPSKFPNKGNGQRLTLQVFVDNSDHIAWSSSVNLQNMITQVPKEGFPFQTTIKRNQSKQFIFT